MVTTLFLSSLLTVFDKALSIEVFCPFKRKTTDLLPQIKSLFNRVK